MTVPAPLPPDPALALVSYSPATFAERGVAVAFTTPELQGARVRAGTRARIEVVVANPAGGRGVYIVPWDGVFAFVRPTVHDRRLMVALSELAVLSPNHVRAAGRAVQQAGFAGGRAAAAADAAQRNAEVVRLQTSFDMLLETLRQSERALAPGSARPSAIETEDELKQRARAALLRLAPSLGCAAQEIADALEAVAGLFADHGMGPLQSGSRVGRDRAALHGMLTDLAGWAAQHPEEAGGEAALVCTAAEHALLCAGHASEQALALTRNMPVLLGLWLRQPDELRRLVARPDWLLDGWHRICLLWSTAEDTLGREMTLLEMAAQLPVLPPEAVDWSRRALPPASVIRRPRKPVRATDWRAGLTAHDIIARNENLLALAA